MFDELARLFLAIPDDRRLAKGSMSPQNVHLYLLPAVVAGLLKKWAEVALDMSPIPSKDAVRCEK